MTRRILIVLLMLYALLSLYSICSLALGGHPSPWFTPINTLRLLGSVFVVSLLFESVGVATGWIYGAYHYAQLLGPLLLGLVPYLIPLSWS